MQHPDHGAADRDGRREVVLPGRCGRTGHDDAVSPADQGGLRLGVREPDGQAHRKAVKGRRCGTTAVQIPRQTVILTDRGDHDATESEVPAQQRHGGLDGVARRGATQRIDSMANGGQASGTMGHRATAQLTPEPLDAGQQVLGRGAGRTLTFEAAPETVQLTVQLAVGSAITMIAAQRVQRVRVCRHLGAPGDERGHSLPCLEVKSGLVPTCSAGARPDGSTRGSSAQLRSMRVQQPFGMLLRRLCAGDSCLTMSATDEKTRTNRPAMS
ncbi:Uncharacterised protein [Mycobacteroides abscessus subsp. abscessus]|nr:Uncharacterised protein [Mycobacteroides abscessus subsp. abscessus]